MSKLKIGVFAYNFKHWKTQVGIQNLCMSGYKPDIILAADPVKLTFYKSKIRTAPKDLFLWHPRDLAKFYNIDYHVVKHNSKETADLISLNDLDVGVILGARILKPVAFNNFNIGVINMHPALLPEVRGLDTIKWAILKNIDQGVTSHLIDSKIDRGLLICRDKIKIYEDDTLVDINIRIQNLEQKIMIDSLKVLEKNGKSNLLPIDQGTYYKSVPHDVELNLMEEFRKYKLRRS